MRANAETAYEPGHQRETYGEQNERAYWIRRAEQMLADQAQGDGGGQPNDQAGAKEAHVHNMNLNSYSHVAQAEASAKFRPPSPPRILESCCILYSTRRDQSTGGDQHGY